jgi:MFS transporter, ACS family, hexuronate transporter
MMEIADRLSRRSEGLYGWVVLGLLFLAQLVMSMGAYAWGPLAPFLRETYAISRSQIGQITSALYITAALTGLPSGIMVDRWGARKLLLACLTIMMISFFFIGLADRFIGIVILAAIAGLGYGVLNQVSTKGIMLWFSAKDRATAMGIKQTGVTIGAAGASVLLPVITAAHGLGPSFIFISVMMFPVILGTAIFYAEKPAMPPAGSAGVIRLTTETNLMRTLFHPEILTILVILPFMCFNQLSLSTFFVLYLTEAVKTSIGVASSCLAVIMVTGAVGRVVWGLISDRFFSGNRQKPLILLSLMGVLCVISLSILPQNAPFYLCVILSAGTGVSFLGWNGLVITYIAELAGTKIAASVVGVSSSIGFIGVISGPLLFGYLVDLFGYFTGWMLLAGIWLANASGLFYLQIRAARKNKAAETGND